MLSLPPDRMPQSVPVSPSPGFCLASALLASLLALLTSSPVLAQQERWFQVEISIFTQEGFNLDGPGADHERWPQDVGSVRYPRNLRKLATLTDALRLSDWSAVMPGEPDADSDNPIPALIGPRRFAPATELALPDITRDAFLRLPRTEHEFTDTNRALANSASHRLLYHAAWRQVVRQPAISPSVAVSGGRLFSDRHELEGSVRFRFNPNEDRVVIDADIWLIKDDTMTQGKLLRMQQSRDMRSNEFHYLDHPALGIVVMVKPYERPADPAPSATAAPFELIPDTVPTRQ